MEKYTIKISQHKNNNNSNNKKKIKQRSKQKKDKNKDHGTPHHTTSHDDATAATNKQNGTEQNEGFRNDPDIHTITHCEVATVVAHEKKVEHAYLYLL